MITREPTGRSLTQLPTAPGSRGRSWRAPFRAQPSRLVLTLQTVTRRNPDSGEVELRAWPAAVFRVRGGKIVFLEGFQDRREAFSDLGIDPE